MSKERYVVHVDMDAFFAAIEQRDNPAYRSRPVVVGADPKGGRGRGVVSTCSYEARRFGIRSAMPISEAYRRCPGAVFLPVDMDRYHDVSSEIYAVLQSFTPDIEPVGIDEAFLDITGSHHLFGSPIDTCKLIKSAILSATGLTASIGLAPTMMAAKIASDLKKPDALVVVSREGLVDFLRPLEIRRIWGLGPKTEKAFLAIGVRTIGDLAAYDESSIRRAFGANGQYFLQLARGVDERRICPERDPKSISGEHTFGEDTADRTRIESVLMRLSERVSARLRENGFRCRTVTLKVRLTGFRTYQRSVTLDNGTNFTDILYNKSKALYNKFEKSEGRGAKVRLLGVRAGNICASSVREDLFRATDDMRLEEIHRAVDKIRGRFGYDCIRHATGIGRKDDEEDRQE